MPTVVWRNNAEGYTTDPTTVTQGSGGNSGGGSGDYWDIVTLGGGTLQATASAKKHGTRGYLFTRSGTGQQNLQKTFAADITDFVMRAWFKIPTQPSTDHQLFKGYSDAAGSVVSWLVLLSGTGKLKVGVGTGATVVFADTVNTVPANVWVRCEVEAISGTSIRVVLYSGDSMTVLADSGVVATNLVAVTRTLRVGLLTTASAPTGLSLDDVTAGSGPGFFGLDTTATPSSLVSNAGAWTAVGAASIPLALDASTSSYVESVSAGTAVKFRVGFPDKVFPEGALTVSVGTLLDIATPYWDLALTAYLNGVSVGTKAIVTNGTTEAITPWVLSGLTGDMSSLEIEFNGTTQ